MKLKPQEQMNFSDYAIAKRKINMTFFNNINAIIDWQAIEKVVDKYYKKGKSVDGRPSYPGILLFKITLLQEWFSLSDEKIEERINDSISFTKFLGLSLEDSVPDHSVISRFRKELTEKKGLAKVLNEVNKQLTNRNILLKKGILIDASLTESNYKPQRPVTFEIATVRKKIEMNQQKKKNKNIMPY